MRTLGAMLLTVGLAGSSVACGTDGSSAIPYTPPEGPIEAADVVTVKCPTKAPDPSRPRVMVVDHGFDVRHPIFSGKIAGCYTLSCPSDGADLQPLAGETDDAAAARLVQDLSTPLADCTLESEISVRIDGHLEHYDPARRNQWNDALLNKTRLDESWTDEANYLLQRLEGIVPEGLIGDPTFFGGSVPDPTFVYHGTSTAGAVAYDNDVDIVFVDDRSLGLRGGSLDCFDQAIVDQEVRLLGRPDVQDAYVHSPISGKDRALSDLRKQHGVGAENHSYSTLPIAEIELALPYDCPRVSLGGLAQLAGDLDAQRDAFLRSSGALDGADPLVFQSAGNEGDALNSAADSFECTPNRVDRFLVGSYDVFRGQAARSDFSNYGECVDLYALGESVVLPGPSGFYVPVFGTSFSSPLAARRASQLWTPGTTRTELHDAVLADRDAYRFLPVSTMPVELSLQSSAVIPASGLAPQSVPFAPRGGNLPARLGLRLGAQ